MIYEDDVLYHHGVKGQKWGVKSAIKSFNTQRASSKREKSWSKLYTNRASMSNADLKAKVNRLTLENNLKQQINTASPKSGIFKKYLKQYGSSLASIAVSAAATATFAAAKKAVGSQLLK